MIVKDDFENRLSQGLKRWATSGEPTLDLEASVKARAQKSPPVKRPWYRRSVYRRLLIPAAAAILLLSAGLSFPSWAGAAAGWPLVGPVVTEIILKDAGLKWAYEQGFIHGTEAAVSFGEVTVKILGVVADPSRTTLIYQITGLPRPEEPGAGKPIQAGSDLISEHPANTGVSISIGRVNGEGSSSWSDQGVWTPIGLVGTVSTLPLDGEEATLEAIVHYQGQKRIARLEASRAETSQFAREVPVNATRSIGGVTVVVRSVIYTPVESIVRYSIEKPNFDGGYGWLNHEGSHYLEAGGKRHYQTQSSVAGVGNGQGWDYTEAFPAVKGPARFVIPADVIGTPIDVTWPLENGAVREVGGAQVTLRSWQRAGETIAFEFWSEGDLQYKGVSGFEVIDEAGQAHQIDGFAQSWSQIAAGELRRTVESKLDPAVKPVAIRASMAGLQVDGPWSFDLPR